MTLPCVLVLTDHPPYPWEDLMNELGVRDSRFLFSGALEV